MQLRKNPPFQINPDDPFQGDELQQKPSIELLTKLIQSTEQPFVITVEAPWGWGKTKFIERWKAHLSKEGHVCLYFNAWENDFVLDPLVAFIGELTPIVAAADGGNDEHSAVRKAFARLQTLGMALVKKGAPIVVKAVASKALGAEAVKDVAKVVANSAESIGDFLSETVKKQIENYDDEKKGIHGFRDTLKELAKDVTKGAGKPKQLVFFVDELDRCRPDFAMTLLERIKHLFNVESVVFVLALDREQIRNTVRYLYGARDQADIYLRKFIDFSFQLPKPSTRSFAELLQARFQMLEFFQGRANARIEYDRFLPTFIDTSNWLNLDLRTQEQCFTRLNAMFRLVAPREFIPTDAFSVLVGLKIGRPELYEGLKLGKIPPSENIPNIRLRYNNDEFPLVVELTLIVVFAAREAVNEEIRRCEQELRVQKDSTTAFSLRRRIELLEHFRIHREELLRLIEFSSRLG